MAGSGGRQTRRAALFAAALIAATQVLVGPAVTGQAIAQPPPPPAWSDAQLSVLRSLWIGSLPPLPPDPSNKVADDPRAVRLGHRLFFDTRLSKDGQVACATCHVPRLAFTDGRKRGRGVGLADRNTMTIVGSAYGPWFFWDGRKDSQWSQALAPLENPVEHGATRDDYLRVIASDLRYREAYEALFGALPDMEDKVAVARAFANLGKALAAYQRRIVPGPSAFDRYVAALLKGDTAAANRHLSREAIAGLGLFIGKGQCTQCHNGPLLTNFTFHNTGPPTERGKPPDKGRLAGIGEALEDPFNCLGAFSDAKKESCSELRFAKTKGADLDGAMKTPTLRNVSKTGPYMHAGQFDTLAAVLDHYNRAPAAATGKTELHALNLSADDLRWLEAFLRSLDSRPAAPPDLLRPPE